MRIYLHLSPNKEIVPFNYQQSLVGALLDEVINFVPSRFKRRNKGWSGKVEEKIRILTKKVRPMNISSI